MDSMIEVDLFMIKLIVSSLGILLLAVLAGVFCVHFFRQARENRRKGLDNFNRPLLFKYLSSPDDSILAAMKKGIHLRDLIVRMSHSVSGDIRFRLMITYTRLGFTKKDFSLMQLFSSERRIKALQRCRTLGIPMQKEGFDFLIKRRGMIVRWAVMEYLISVKGKKAVNMVMEFLHQKQNRRRGVAVHLLTEIAKKSPESIPYLLEHTDDDFIRVAVLIVLQKYPVPSSVGIITRSIKGNDNVEVLINGVKALAALTEPGMASGFKLLAGHKHWVVRMTVAHAVGRVPGLEMEPTLKNLLEDISYQVRKAACASLLSFARSGTALELYSDIKHNERHPSYYLINQSLEMTAQVRMAS